jgi:hypothetical protein
MVLINSTFISTMKLTTLDTQSMQSTQPGIIRYWQSCVLESGSGDMASKTKGKLGVIMNHT